MTEIKPIELKYYYSNIAKPLEVSFHRNEAWIYLGKQHIATAHLETFKAKPYFWWVEEFFGNFKNHDLDSPSLLRIVNWLAQDFVKYCSKMLGLPPRRAKLKNIVVTKRG